MKRRHAALALALPLLLQLPGCERMLHNMYDQPRGKAYRSSEMFPDGSGSRTPPPGTVVYARGARPGSSSGRLGAQEAEREARDSAALTQPYPLNEQLLAHGRERFNIYCMPCHSAVGDGDGRIVQRGFPAPPSYHGDRLRGVPDRYIYTVISNGYGVMASYADRLSPSERWAIVAYVRALQLSQHAKLDHLPAAVAAQARKALAVQAGTPAGNEPASTSTGSGDGAQGSASGSDTAAAPAGPKGGHP
ncbi:c-type cytochrome [Eoetvoesiella caeni]|uniref:Cbb3-type cytochrome c oxidase subunit III n=1 Tax=Eoetvoesiella caeni TaxID=645616 RepID=A0A366H206_9BURK|nr:cytochrome c [Eoetvoesiella caeni]MCI2810787.1 cytochrome c [Eoetvoesiella caeni]RBP35807.1 cbb3-type cytochrome c oxidase subunit III [Eoetvoesiella caeni]